MYVADLQEVVRLQGEEEETRPQERALLSESALLGREVESYFEDIAREVKREVLSGQEDEKTSHFTKMYLDNLKTIVLRQLENKQPQPASIQL